MCHMCETPADEPISIIDPKNIRETAAALEIVLAKASSYAELLAAAARCRDGLASLSEQPSGRSVMRKKAHDYIDEWLRTINTMPLFAPANTTLLLEIHHALEEFADVYRYEPPAVLPV